jgi:hypothetical protein
MQTYVCQRVGMGEGGAGNINLNFLVSQGDEDKLSDFVNRGEIILLYNWKYII